jgi:hypothetical protein
LAGTIHHASCRTYPRPACPLGHVEAAQLFRFQQLLQLGLAPPVQQHHVCPGGSSLAHRGFDGVLIERFSPERIAELALRCPLAVANRQGVFPQRILHRPQGGPLFL